jgi:hypothetical protein
MATYGRENTWKFDLTINFRNILIYQSCFQQFLYKKIIRCITLKCNVKLLFICEALLNMAITGSPCLQLCTVWCLQMNFTHWTYFSFYLLIYQEDKHKTCASFIDLGITTKYPKNINCDQQWFTFACFMPSIWTWLIVCSKGLDFWLLDLDMSYINGPLDAWHVQ